MLYDDGTTNERSLNMSSPAKKNLVAYVRVSTKKQGVSGLGLEAQRAAVAEYAKREGLRVVAEYVEVESGKKASRPELAKAMSHCRAAKAKLVVAKLDRLARNVAFLSALMESNLDFVALDNEHANRLTLHVLAAVAERIAHSAHLVALRDALLSGLAALPDLAYHVNSPVDGAPGIVNVGFHGCESDALMMLLDAAEIEVSTGSACTVGIPRPSHVLLAMGQAPPDARSALRVSFGRTSTLADVDALLAVLPDAVGRARRAGQWAVAGGA